MITTTGKGAVNKAAEIAAWLFASHSVPQASHPLIPGAHRGPRQPFSRRDDADAPVLILERDRRAENRWRYHRLGGAVWANLQPTRIGR